MFKLVGVLALLGLSMPSHAAEYLVKYRSTGVVQAYSRSSTVRILDVHEAGSLMKVQIPEASKAQALVQLSTDPSVEYVVPNVRMHLFKPVDARALKTQWAVEKVQAEKAWQKAGNKGSKKIVVAVIDTGIDSKHPALSPNMVDGYDFAENDNDPMDEIGQNPGHGTHCAGVIGSTGLVEGGTIGLSPVISIMPIRFLDATGGGDLDNAVKSIDYAVEKKVDVISASWGAAIGRTQAMPIIEAMQRAEKAGIVFVVAASNDGKNNDSYEVYPANANLTNTISVAASDVNDKKPSWSNFGPAKVNLAAPGNEIMSTLPSNKYGNLSGTSMATPLVAGLVALVKAQDNSLEPLQIRSLLQATGVTASISTACDCRVDAFNAIEAVEEKKMFVSPFATTVAIGETQQFEAVYGKAPFEFTSSNPSAGTIDSKGTFTGVAAGETTVAVKDSKGITATSYKIYVGAPKAPPSEPGMPGSGECPFGDAATCEMLCQISPMPWCE